MNIPQAWLEKRLEDLQKGTIMTAQFGELIAAVGLEDGMVTVEDVINALENG